MANPIQRSRIGTSLEPKTRLKQEERAGNRAADANRLQDRVAQGIDQRQDKVPSDQRKTAQQEAEPNENAARDRHRLHDFRGFILAIPPHQPNREQRHKIAVGILVVVPHVGHVDERIPMHPQQDLDCRDENQDGIEAAEKILYIQRFIHLDLRAGKADRRTIVGRRQ